MQKNETRSCINVRAFYNQYRRYCFPFCLSSVRCLDLQLIFKILRLSEDSPVIIEIVDSEENVNKLLPFLDEAV
ncbi:MAG: DUF190 domain-containing protein [Candidatus Aminicenantes bacterium]|nr:DUF190 domain-containing protein [Candidatus Aminicenantes bacterium]